MPAPWWAVGSVNGNTNLSDDALSMLAEWSAPEMHLSGVWLVTAGALALALIARRRLPVGVGDALFITGLSVALGAAYLPGDGSVAWPLRLSALLTGLAVLWHFGVRWVERDSEPTGSNDADKTPAIPPDDALSAPRSGGTPVDRRTRGRPLRTRDGGRGAGVAQRVIGASAARRNHLSSDSAGTGTTPIPGRGAPAQPLRRTRVVELRGLSMDPFRSRPT